MLVGNSQLYWGLTTLTNGGPIEAGLRKQLQSKSREHRGSATDFERVIGIGCSGCEPSLGVSFGGNRTAKASSAI